MIRQARVKPVTSALIALLITAVFTTLIINMIKTPTARAAEAATTNNAIAVTDFLGREVTLEQPAQRIVALAPHVVENLFAAGVGDRIVAAVSYSDYPEQAKSIPRVGGYSNFSLEAIVAFKPDLVISWASGSSSSNQLETQLSALDIPVYVSEPRRLEDVAEAIRDFAVLAGNPAVGEQAALAYLQQLDELRRENQDKASVTVFYQIWHSPLQTLNGEHLVSDMIGLCKGRNIFADALGIAPKVSVEAVLAANPQVIVASGIGEQRPDWLDQWYDWPSLSAVQQGSLYFIPPDWSQRHTTRILKGARLLCEQLDRAR